MKKMSREEALASVKKYHDHSWYEDIKERNVDNLDSTAIAFRKNNISYRTFEEYVEKEYAPALRQAGIKKGSEFVCCIRQVPDYPMLFGAASLTGSSAIFVNDAFDKDFLTQLINESDSNVTFVSDWDFISMLPVYQKMSKDKKVVVIPVSKWDKYNNPFKEVTDRFFKFDEEAFQKAFDSCDNAIMVDEFLAEGKKFQGEVNGHGKLEDPVAVTYTSGSTKKGIHKGVVQRNETYIIMGRYHDPEVAGIPKMDKTITYAAGPTNADTLLLTGVSDTMMQGGIVALDPILHEYYFPYALLFNNAGLAIGTRTYWLRAMKEWETNPELKGKKLPGLYVPSEGGEPLAAGEEKALNSWLKKVKAGTAITHTPTSIVKMTVGGGDSENGSIFLTLFRDYYNKLQKIRGIHEPAGLGYYNFCDVKVLREDGTYCDTMEMGRLVSISPMTMKEYHRNVEDTNAFFITDAYGKKWGNMNTYAYIDKSDKVYIKGRISENDPEIKNFQVQDAILVDTKNIMSCEVIDFKDANGETYYIAHIEFQMGKKVNERKALLSAEERCINKFGDRLKGKVFFRVRTNTEGFPTLFTAKRNMLELREEGLTEKCIIPSAYYSEEKAVVKKLTK